MAHIVPVTFVTEGGERVEVKAEAGQSLMQVAVSAGLEGIIAECGGYASCATCHMYVAEIDGDSSEVGDEEEEMLDFTAAPRTDESRLSCQVVLTDAMESVTARIPDRQK